MQRVGIIGAGAWGTALAQATVRAGLDTLLWGREEALIQTINNTHENDRYLPGITLEPNLTATNDAEHLATHGNFFLLVCPAQHLRHTLTQFKPYLSPDKPLVICSKGIELETGALMSEVIAEVTPDTPYAVLSGPTFATEVAMGKPAAMTLATSFNGLGKELAETLNGKMFRPYVSKDPIGVEIGGAVKNVIAIACGIVHGAEMGENAKAAIMTRGLAEITRMGSALGAKKTTFLGLAGMGDLCLTCNSMQSRNFSLGVMRGQGQSLNEILAKRRSVTEGVATASAVLEIAQKHAIEMPICKAVNAMLNDNVSIDDTIEALMSRPLKQEI